MPYPPSKILVLGKLDNSQALQLILDFVNYGDHQNHEYRHIPDQLNVLEEQGYRLHERVLELTENHNRAVPWFENLVDQSSVELAGTPGVQIRGQQLYKGIVVQEVEVGHHGYLTLEYLTLFKSAIKARDRAIADSSIEDVHLMLAAGQASIEAFLNMNAKVHNARVTPEEKIAMNGRMPTPEKLKIWTPKIALRQVEIEKLPAWEKFNRLRQLRNNRTHNSGQADISTMEQAASVINDFRQGYVGLLAFLHLVFGDPLPSRIIRAVNFPNVSVT